MNIRKIKIIISFILLNIILIGFSTENLAVEESFIEFLKNKIYPECEAKSVFIPPTDDPGEIPGSGGSSSGEFEDSETIILPYYTSISGHVYEESPIEDDEKPKIESDAQKRELAIDDEGTLKEKVANVKGVYVSLKDDDSSNHTVTKGDGSYKFEGITPGEYHLSFIYGSLEKSIPSSDATIYDVLKYNGYDYSASKITTNSGEVPDYDYNAIRKELEMSRCLASQVFILIDMSQSMTSDDTKFKLAMDSARTLVNSLIEGSDNIYVGIIGYSGNSWRIAGLTKDKEYLKKQLDILEGTRNQANTWLVNTDIVRALTKAQRSFYEGDPDEEEDDFDDDPSNRNIILISDGVPTADFENDLQIFQEGDESYDETTTKLNKIVDNTKAKLQDLTEEDNVNVMALISPTSDSTEKTLLDRIYKDVNLTYSIAESAQDLANKIKKDSKQWVIDHLQEGTSENYGGKDCLESIEGLEDANRRAKVDENFEGTFYYNIKDADIISHIVDASSLTANSSIFKEIENGIGRRDYSAGDDADKLSKASYMKVDFKDPAEPPEDLEDPDILGTCLIQAKEDVVPEDYDESDSSWSREVIDGKDAYVYTVDDYEFEDGHIGQFKYIYILEESSYEVNLYLQRRQSFSLATKVTATAAKITLNDNKLLAFHKRDVGDEVPLLEVLDDDISHGATVQLEYAITVKNDSSTSCNYLELVNYIPEGFTYSDEATLLTEENVKNNKYRWISRDITDLCNSGYIDEAAKNDHSTNDVLTLLLCDPEILGNEDDVIEEIGEEAAANINWFSAIVPGGEFTVKLVISRVIDRAEDATGTIHNDVEVLGYHNSAERRLAIESSDSSELGFLKGFYPGDNKDIDFSRPTNNAFIVPPTGGITPIEFIREKMIFIVPTVAITIMASLIYIKKKKK